MATVVNLQKDTRAAELGVGVANFLNNMHDRRLDGLQRELMEEISKSPDEATAAALIADPKFEEISGDPERLAASIGFLNNARLGTESITGYDSQGQLQVRSIPKGSNQADAFTKFGLTPERDRLFSTVPNNDPDAFPEPIPNRFGNAGEAAESVGLNQEDFTVLDQEQTALRIQSAANRISTKQRQIGLDLDQAKFDFEMNKPLTPFDRLITAFENGNMTEPQFNQAWTRLVHLGFGRTPNDVADKTKVELNERGALIASMSEQAVFLMNKVRDDRTLISKVGSIPRLFDNISAELDAVGSLFGITKKPLEAYEFGGFSAQSTAFKNMLLSFGIAFAASEGQSNRALSDKDFDRFLKIVGSDVSNPVAFIESLNQLVLSKQRAFNIQHDRLQGFNYEAVNGNFASFDFDPTGERKREIEALVEKYPALAGRFEDELKLEE